MESINIQRFKMILNNLDQDTLIINIKYTLLKTHMKIVLLTLDRNHTYDLIKRRNLIDCIKDLNYFIHDKESIKIHELLKGFDYKIIDNQIIVNNY